MGSFWWCPVTGQEVFHLNMKEPFFPVSVVEHWHRLLSLELFKSHLGMVWGSCLQVAQPGDDRGPFQPHQFCDSVQFSFKCSYSQHRAHIQGKNLMLSVEFKTEGARVNLTDLLSCKFFFVFFFFTKSLLREFIPNFSSYIQEVVESFSFKTLEGLLIVEPKKKKRECDPVAK